MDSKDGWEGKQKPSTSIDDYERNLPKDTPIKPVEPVDKTVRMGFSSGQFIIRMPREIQNMLELVEGNRPQFRFDVKDHDVDKGIVKGEFTIWKNGNHPRN